MTSMLRSLFLLPLTVLVACGPNTIPGAGGTASATSGDYVLSVGVGTANATQLSGGLNIQGSSVSGNFLYSNVHQAGCLALPISVTGTINGSYTKMTLTSSAFASGSVATFTIPLPLTSTTSGSYSTTAGTAVIVGGNCALASTSLQAFIVPSFSGSWSFAFTSGSVTSATASLDVLAPIFSTVSSGATTSSTFAVNSNGQFPATGSFSYSATGCNIAATALTGYVSGYTLMLTDSTNTYEVSVSKLSSPASVSISGGCTNGASTSLTQN